MTRRWRIWVFLCGALATGGLFGATLLGIPGFGSTHHPYRDRAVAAATLHRTANVVASVNFDQRGLDTLGEESILLASIVGVSALLRVGSGEREQEPPTAESQVMQSTKLLGYLTLGITVLIGFDIVVHGHVTPGGGFQGGIVIGTGLHLLYVAGTYRTLRRFRPVEPFELAEAVGAGAFASFGVAGVVAGGGFLANVVPQGHFGDLLSAGTVPILNVAVGLAVASATMVLLAQFLAQAMEITGAASRSEPESGRGGR